MQGLLSRYAECNFWLARYMERAENLARIIDVNETFSRTPQGALNWQAVVQINADEKRFRGRHPSNYSAAHVLDFYVLDAENPSSIRSAVKMARENARALRPLISTEMWMQINTFHNWLRQLGASDLSLPRMPQLCGRIKVECQTHTGILEGTYYRDQGWFFYRLGKYIERSDQTTRLLDTKYHMLLPSPEDVGSPLDTSHWNAVLRSSAGYHAYRRVHPRGMSARNVAGFLLFNEGFPRSVRVCVQEVDRLLTALRSRVRLRGGIEARERTDELLRALETRTIDQVIEFGLHEFNDWIQQELTAISRLVDRAYFGHADG